MNNEQKKYLQMLLDNFRVSEAIGYIAALDENELSDCEQFLYAYRKILNDGAWLKEDVDYLRHVSKQAKAYSKEMLRIVDLIEILLASNKKVILNFIATYYATANQCTILFRNNMQMIKQWFENSLVEKQDKNILKPIGGYEELEFYGEKISELYQLGNIYKYITSFTLRV